MDNLTWDDEVTLIAPGEYVEDDLGQQKMTEIETMVCCCERPVSRQEFYSAGQSGIQVVKILIIHPYEYSGENEVIFEGKRLRVVKAYKINQEELELTCSEKLGDKNGKKD